MQPHFLTRVWLVLSILCAAQRRHVGSKLYAKFSRQLQGNAMCTLWLDMQHLHVQDGREVQALQNFINGTTLQNNSLHIPISRCQQVDKARIKMKEVFEGTFKASIAWHLLPTFSDRFCMQILQYHWRHCHSITCSLFFATQHNGIGQGCITLLTRIRQCLLSVPRDWQLHQTAN